MPTVTVQEMYSGPGPVWRRVVELWEAWLVDATKTWAFTANTTVNSRRAAIVTLTAGANVDVYQLVDYGQNATTRYPADFVQCQPGWNTVTKAWAPTVAGRTVATEWNGKLVAARKAILDNWTNASSSSYAERLESWNATLNGLVRVRYLGWIEQCRGGTDYTSLVTYEATASDTIPGDVNIAPPVQVTNVTTIGGGGGSTDIEPVVEALNDIAAQDYNISLNNGQTIFSVKGRSTTS